MVLLRFSRGSGLAGAIVRWETWSWTSHVGFLLPNDMVLDATPELGVSIRERSDDETTQYWKPLAPTVIQDQAVKFAKLQLGKPYDWTAIFGMAVRRDWHHSAKWFCSELIEGSFRAARWPLVRDSGNLDRITPRDLLLSTRIERVPTPPKQTRHE